MPSPLADLLAAFAAAVRPLGMRWYLFGALAAGGFRLRVDHVEDFVERPRVVPLAYEPTGIPIDVVLAGRPEDCDGAAAVLSAQAGRMDLGVIREILRLLEAALDQRDLLPLFEELVGRVHR